MFTLDFLPKNIFWLRNFLETIFVHKFFWTQILDANYFWIFFWDLKFFLTKSFLWHKNCSDPWLFWHKFFLTTTCFGPKFGCIPFFFGPKRFWIENFVAVEFFSTNYIFFNPNIFWTISLHRMKFFDINYFWDPFFKPKSFSGPQIFFILEFFSD